MTEQYRQEPMNFCVDCKWYEFDGSDKKEKFIDHFCVHPSHRNLITGKQLRPSCLFVRNIYEGAVTIKSTIKFCTKFEEKE